MKYLIMSCVLWLCAKQAQCQQNQSAFIKGYEDFYSKEDLYFDSINKLWNKEIACFDIVHEVYASFRVDTNANIVNLQITEIPLYKLPKEMKAYIEKLIISTNGRWSAQVVKGQKVISDEILYRFDFLKANQTIQQRADAGEKLRIFSLENGNKIDVVRRFYDGRKGKIFTILY
jgi:hypothetical protein